MRARSSPKLLSLSAKRGGSCAARRATEFFAMSQAICTCRVRGNMSGARRALSSTPGSNLRCSACFTLFSSSAERFPSTFANISTDMACIEIFMVILVKGSGCQGAQILARQDWRACLSGETIAQVQYLIEAAMSLLWIPAQLAMLAKVVDLNGFSAAARALGVPKAAVSRAVADLEKSLGVKVLERTTRRIALTNAGRLVYPHARRVLDEADAARTAITKLQSPDARALRVVADPTYGRVLLTPLVPRFLEAFPDMPLEVAMDNESAVEGWDVAIRPRTVP